MLEIGFWGIVIVLTVIIAREASRNEEYTNRICTSYTVIGITIWVLYMTSWSIAPSVDDNYYRLGTEGIRKEAKEELNTVEVNKQELPYLALEKEKLYTGVVIRSLITSHPSVVIELKQGGSGTTVALKDILDIKRSSTYKVTDMIAGKNSGGMSIGYVIEEQ